MEMSPDLNNRRGGSVVHLELYKILANPLVFSSTPVESQNTFLDLGQEEACIYAAGLYVLLSFLQVS